MLSFKKTLAGAAGAAAIALAPIPLVLAADAAENVAVGKDIVMDRAKGNCIACHVMEGGESPGNIGPPLVAMKARYPEAKRLRDQIWDSTAANPVSAMPPFGKHQILSEEQIDQVVAFILTL